MKFYEQYKNVIDREVVAAKYLAISSLNFILFNSNSKLKLRKAALKQELSRQLDLK